MVDAPSDTMVHLREVGVAGAYVRPSAVVALVSLDSDEMRSAGFPGEIGGTAIMLQGGGRVIATSALGLLTDVATKLGLA